MLALEKQLVLNSRAPYCVRLLCQARKPIHHVIHDSCVVPLVKRDFPSAFIGITYVACIFRKMYSVTLTFYAWICLVIGLEKLVRIRRILETWYQKLAERRILRINNPEEPMRTALSVPSARRMGIHGTYKVVRQPSPAIEVENFSLMLKKTKYVSIFS